MSSTLIKNPRLIIKHKPIGHEILALIVQAPVRGYGLQIHKVKIQEEPELFRVLFEMADVPADTPFADYLENHPHLSESGRNRLVEMGVFITNNQISPPVHFHCFLDPSTCAMVPYWMREVQNPKEKPEGQDGLIVNPRFLYQEGEELPEEIRSRVRFGDFFLKGDPLVWIENPGTHLLSPYWVKEQEGAFFKSLRPGKKPARDIDPEWRKILQLARILVPATYLQDCRDIWEKFYEKARRDYQTHRYITLDSLLPPLQLAALRRYFRELIAAGYVRLGDYDSPFRYNAHNEGLLYFYQYQLAYFVSRIVQTPLKPSHNHYVRYHSGAVLRMHKDFDQHEYGFSVLVDYDPEPLGVTPWPLILEKEGANARVEVQQAIGNALFYNACELIHGRGAIPEGHSSASILFHFVPQDYQGPLEYSPFYF